MPDDTRTAPPSDYSWRVTGMGTKVSLSELAILCARGPFHERFCHRNSNSMEISFCSFPICVQLIATEFCICHNNCAVVPCANFCSDTMSYNEFTPRPNFHWICISVEKSLVKWAMARKCLCYTFNILWHVQKWPLLWGRSFQNILLV